jgi:hypothetical protein
MKGTQGLVLVAVFGVLGVTLNWIYLQNKTRDVETNIQFLGIASGATIDPGQVIKEEILQAVPIPERHAGKLKDYVYLYQDRGTVAGITATRRYQGGDLVYREHYRTPPAELKLGPGEKLIWIPVTSNSFVPELVNPGDRIEFIVPVHETQPVTAAIPGEAQAVPVAKSVRTESIGPFRVGSLGNRLAAIDVARGNRMATSQERLVGIIISTKDAKEQENASRLQGRVLSGDYHSIGVALLERVRS